MLNLPPVTERPLFEVDVLKPPFLHLLHRPFGGQLVIAAVGDARTVHLRHPEQVFHRLRMLEGLGLDLSQGVEIDFVASRSLRDTSRDDEEGSCQDRCMCDSLPEAERVHVILAFERI